MKGIKNCGECVNYDWRRHKCRICKDEGTAQDPFYADCPLPDVKEVKHGEWIYQISDLFPADSTKECNQCHARQNLFCDDEYCLHCGAKMDEKKKR